VHGCFWHGHDCQHGLRRPNSNTEFWKAKYRDNKLRDERKERALRDLGWKSFVVWECEIKQGTWVSRAKRFLGPGRSDRHRPKRSTQPRS
jgi:DNA mismatch endonuclease, patch repair protein